MTGKKRDAKTTQLGNRERNKYLTFLKDYSILRQYETEIESE